MMDHLPCFTCPPSFVWHHNASHDDLDKNLPATYVVIVVGNTDRLLFPGYRTRTVREDPRFLCTLHENRDRGINVKQECTEATSFCFVTQ